MNNKTKADYRKLAKNFYATRLNGEKPTPKKLADALRSCAPEYSVSYWYRLRRAIAFDQEEKGFKKAVERLKGFENPLLQSGRTQKGKKIPKKPSQPRSKGIKKDQHKKLIDAITAKKDWEVMSAIILARNLGVRPAEMNSLICLDKEQKIIINGAKKVEDGSRGANRTIVLDDPELYDKVKKAAKIINGKRLKPIQERLRRVAEKTFPSTKKRPTLYTYRHLMGSLLKASGKDRREMAYIMGHQGTRSIETYGSRKSGTNSPFKLGVDADPMRKEMGFDGVRDTHLDKPIEKAKEQHWSKRMIEKKIQQQPSQPKGPSEGSDFDKK